MSIKWPDGTLYESVCSYNNSTISAPSYRYGLPESAMTMGTRQFLMGNRIVDADDEPNVKNLAGTKNKTGSKNRSENNAFLHDLTQMLQQPKFKP